MKNPDNRFHEYARWFRCLADGTRNRILHFVSTASQPLTVGQIVDAVGKSQSTVSQHLQILAEGGFVFMRADGNRTLVQVNQACMTALPDAAADLMGRVAAPRSPA